MMSLQGDSKCRDVSSVKRRNTDWTNDTTALATEGRLVRLHKALQSHMTSNERSGGDRGNEGESLRP